MSVEIFYKSGKTVLCGRLQHARPFASGFGGDLTKALLFSSLLFPRLFASCFSVIPLFSSPLEASFLRRPLLATELNARAAADSSHRFLFSSFLRTAFRAAVHRSRFRCRIRCSSFSGTTCFSFPPLFSALLLVFHAPLSLLFSVTDVCAFWKKSKYSQFYFSPYPFSFLVLTEPISNFGSARLSLNFPPSQKEKRETTANKTLLSLSIFFFAGYRDGRKEEEKK